MASAGEDELRGNGKYWSLDAGSSFDESCLRLCSQFTSPAKWPHEPRDYIVFSTCLLFWGKSTEAMAWMHSKKWWVISSSFSSLRSRLFQACCPSYWVAIWKAPWVKTLWTVFFFLAEWERLKVHLPFSFIDTNSVWQSAPKRTIHHNVNESWPDT